MSYDKTVPEVILFRTGQTCIQRLYGVICMWLLDSPYGHVSVMVGEGRFGASAYKGKFIQETPLDPKSKKMITVIRLPGMKIRDRDIKPFMGIPYDKWGALLVWTERWHNPRKLFCFEAVGLILQNQGMQFKDKRVYNGAQILRACLKNGFTSETKTEGEHALDRAK